MRRAQVEMVGLVFVVLIIVLGIFLYLRFSKTAEPSNLKDEQRTNSFLIALTETTVPACGEPFARVAQSCMLHEETCQDPCGQLKNTMGDIAKLALAGSRYRLALENEGGTAAAEVHESCAKDAASVTGGRQPIPFGNGRTAYLVLELCR